MIEIIYAPAVEEAALSVRRVLERYMDDGDNTRTSH